MCKRSIQDYRRTLLYYCNIEEDIIEDVRLAISGENIMVLRLQEAEDLLRGQAVNVQSLKDGLAEVAAQACKNALPQLSPFYQHLALEYGRQILEEANEKRKKCDFLNI